MYWPSVQEDRALTAAPAATAALRLFCRPVHFDMDEHHKASPSGSLLQPLSTLIQPIADKVRRSLTTTTSAAAFDQSALTSAVHRAAFSLVRKHEQPDCGR